MKKYIFALILSVSVMCSMRAQSISMVTEISWTTNYLNYTGLLVMYSDNTGAFVVKNFMPNVGWIRIIQDATLTNKYDIYGNCTTYINCYNPLTDPPVLYYADNFVLYPNGKMYTQDAAGNWSALVAYTYIAKPYWVTKLTEYGLL